MLSSDWFRNVLSQASLLCLLWNTKTKTAWGQESPSLQRLFGTESLWGPLTFMRSKAFLDLELSALYPLTFQSGCRKRSHSPALGMTIYAEVRPGRSFRWVWHARQPQLCAPVKEAFLAPQACRNFRDLTQIFVSEVKTLRSMDSKGLTEVMSCVGVWLSLGSLSFELGPSPGEFPSFGPRARNLSLPSVWGEDCACGGVIRAGGKSESQ